VKRSTERILTTHVGSLVRPVPILRGMKARTIEQPYDQKVLAEDIRNGVHEVVREQVEVGIDIPCDGEFGRPGFVNYIHERLSGIERRPLDPDEDIWAAGADREQQVFPEFFEQYHDHFRYLWMPPEVPIDDVPNLPGNYEKFRLVDKVKYVGQQAIKQDIKTLKSALRGLAVADAFMNAVSPMQRVRSDRNVQEFYRSEEDYMYALADVMHEEYKAITDAGFLLQVDLGALNPRRGALQHNRNPTSEEMTKAMELAVDVLNHALQGIPEDQVRYHHCWGSMNSPHTQDQPLRQIVGPMLKINAQAYVLEAANPRHEHEWMVWQDVKLPDGKILIPGVISHQTNVVEHPELVAWRLTNFASVVGRENLIGGVDCGFSQYWDSMRVHPTVQWAKLRALVDGAALASRELWS
jgi:5-methyltetrahydropteroyltriglutamate--homocysteine methyltransferase